jgi:hypothetical protein
VDSVRFRQWFLQSGEPESYDVIELACFNYGLTKHELVLPTSHAGLLIRTTAVTQFLVLNKEDRYFYKDAVVFPQSWRVKLMAVHHEDHYPLIHHYSYVALLLLFYSTWALAMRQLFCQ